MTDETPPAPTVMTPEATAASEAPTAASTAITTSTDAADNAVMADAQPSEPAAAVTRPAWQQIALIDARSGATFTLADFAGKTVFVEPFATWCGDCRQQLGNVQAAKSALGEDVVFVALSVEPNIGADVLARYADDAGFDWTFAAMPPELLQALAAQFGQTIANPPATPHFLIRPDGSTTDLVTGIESPDAIKAQIEAARG
jgi:cytochrome oxidase Cu insertion factor (SCO1/SenC/PrrC family)